MKRKYVLLCLLGITLAACSPKPTAVSLNQDADFPTAQTAPVNWQFNGRTWQAMGEPPTCPEPLILEVPVDLKKASAILYPGQVRGGNYKPHGGFRFDGVMNNQVAVTAPLDAQLVRASRYLENGEVQYLLDFVASCGIMYRLDHLLTLSPTFAKAVESLPQPQKDDSRTHAVGQPIAVKKGEVIATAVGFERSKNVSVDWGVYDLRAQNAAAQNGRVQGNPELAAHAVCWLDWLTSSNKAAVKALPAGDAQSGKTSDYCL